ncbi:hypothetical protein HU200_034559 [Digitaria exilis]|uniref:Reverse transcriptase zinc-binding domain-containing protein n=1 Tax=Digitaria exilis TaxID=1010633 RepID=A0A835BJB0_9POAL|nr:hypothetical protein HU200_034559 [Digitaria exilis]
MAEQRKRHNLQDNDDCIFCSQHPESIDHLLLNCSFSREVWFIILQGLDWQSISPTGTDLSFVDWWNQSRRAVCKDNRKHFDSLVILVAWSIWLERNARTFNRQQRTASQLAMLLKHEAAIWAHDTFIQPSAAAATTFSSIHQVAQ